MDSSSSSSMGSSGTCSTQSTLHEKDVKHIPALVHALTGLQREAVLAEAAKRHPDVFEEMKKLVHSPIMRPITINGEPETLYELVERAVKYARADEVHNALHILNPLTKFVAEKCDTLGLTQDPGEASLWDYRPDEFLGAIDGAWNDVLESLEDDIKDGSDEAILTLESVARDMKTYSKQLEEHGLDSLLQEIVRADEFLQWIANGDPRALPPGRNAQKVGSDQQLLVQQLEQQQQQQQQNEMDTITASASTTANNDNKRPRAPEDAGGGGGGVQQKHKHQHQQQQQETTGGGGDMTTEEEDQEDELTQRPQRPSQEEDVTTTTITTTNSTTTTTNSASNTSGAAKKARVA